MKKHTWIIFGAVGLAGSLWLGAGLSQAAGIPPVNMTPPFAPTSGPLVTIISNGVDVTATWLPEPGQAVTILVGGVVPSSITLVAPGPPNPISPTPSLTTSAYPGTCTNFGSHTDTSADFSLTGNTLTPTDCGGMAVLQINGATYILPQDSDFDGLPDIWEAKYCTSPNVICLNPLADTDGGPPSNLLVGEGIAVFDEYRGFMVSPADLRDGVLLAADPTHSKHIRTDPRQKDLFVHLVNNNLCADTNTHPPATSYLGGGAKTYPTDGSHLFDNLNTLIAGTQIHLLGYTPNAPNSTTDQWVDRFVSMAVNVSTKNDRTITFTGGVTAPPADDRQINLNAVYPLNSAVTDPVTGLVTLTTMLKGIRLIECLDNMVNTTTYGYAGYGQPLEADRAFLYTQRIVDHANLLIAGGGTKKLQYLTSRDNGKTWVAQAAFNGQITGSTPPSASDKDVIISKFIQYILAMELGHSVKLTPTQEGTTSNPTKYQYHHAPQSGSNLDVDITNSTSSTLNKFYVPSAYNTNDETSFIATKKP